MIRSAVTRRLSAILAADVVAYSRLMGADEAGTLARLKAVRSELIRPMLADHHGRVVKTTGDGILIEFRSVVDAVACAAEMQQRMSERNAGEAPERRIEFRVGINIGDVIVEGRDIYGDGVNIAARLEALAPAGGICMSRRVYEDVAGKVDLLFEDLGEQTLKNIERPVHVYRLAPAALAVPVLAEDAGAGRLEPAPIRGKPSIAVLPFANMSGDPEQEYFSDGITEDIITALSRLRWFFVIARNSTFVYKGRAVDVKQVGRELGVRYVLEGSVRKVGTRVRISAQLVEAASGAHHWAERYDRELTDIFALQDEITQNVTAAIEPKLVAAETLRAQSRSAEDVDAWDLVMRALPRYWRMTTADSGAAIALLRQAVVRYPSYGPAHSMLAFALLVSGHVGWTPERGSITEAAAAAQRAATLDDEDPWAHMALGYLAFTERRTDDAVREFRGALELNPNFALAYGYLAWALVFDGRSEEAIENFARALRMSPHDPLKAFFYSGTGVGHYFAHRYDEAVAWAKEAIQQRPEFIAAHRILCASSAQAGRVDETRATVARLKELQPNLSIAWIEQYVPYTASAMPHFLDGMRKAGIR